MINELVKRYSALQSETEAIEAAADTLVSGFKNGKKLLVCGNGGSCADCEHMVGELMKGFLSKRPLSKKQKSDMKANCPEISDEYLNRLQSAVPTISLPSFTALNTAFCNDVDPELVFAQPIMGLGQAGDMLIAISTSGNSKNVVAAALTAKALGLKTIGLTGKTGGKLKSICDICICVSETETFKVQELHLPVYHYLCAYAEKKLFTY